ncbi:glutathione transferase GST 23-like [Aristolochia californica]|uniref:glutathione transferase GST 23-like n=1 Tax=Aristolochia californica TaxID=171875 RepID=UPI0035DAA525
MQLIGCWPSPLALRVEWSLKLKGIEYEYIEEFEPRSSPLIMKYNPIHKQIPVLVHGGKPIPESLIILEYLDEISKENKLLPEDPYQRARARFWAKFADDKIYPALVETFRKSGKELEEAVKEAGKTLKTLEQGLEGKKFFGGDSVGFVDIVAGWIAYWTPMIEEILGLKIIDENEAPALKKWFQDILDIPVLKQCLPPREKLLSHLRGKRLELSGVGNQ